MTDDTNDGQLMTDTTTSATQSITVNRVIEAPLDRVYDAFLNPDELATWLPPSGFSAEVHEFEPTVGGTFRITFTAETDELEPYARSFGGEYLKLVPGEKIAYVSTFESDDPGMAGETMVSVTFEAVRDGTGVTLVQTEIPEAVPADDAKAGWTDSLGNLAGLVEEA